MRFTKSEFQVFFIGAILLVPLNVFVLGTQIFFLQTLLICGLLYYIVNIGARGVVSQGPRMPALDAIFYLYIAWIVFSFLLNLILTFDPLAIQARRIISVGMALILMSGYFVGRAIGFDGKKADALIKGVFFTYIFVLTYLTIVLVTYATNLYMVKRVIGQRLPFVIAFIASLASAYYLAGRRKRVSGFVAISGLIFVMLSLTRAAYVQVLASMGMLVVRYVRFSIKRLVLAIIVVFLIAVPAYYVFEDANATKQIVRRFEQTFDVQKQSTEDPSGSARIAMWTFIGEKLLSEPLHMVFGYGQLGPTFITSDLVWPDGTVGGSSAHSQYIDIVVREGLVGLLIFLAICYKALELGWSKRLSMNHPAATFVFANTVALGGIMFYGIFHETVRYPMYGFYFWLYLGMLSGISQKTRGDAVEKDSSGT